MRYVWCHLLAWLVVMASATTPRRQEFQMAMADIQQHPQADVILIADGSGSISKPDWGKMISVQEKLATDLLLQRASTTDSIRVGVLRFDTKVEVVSELSSSLEHVLTQLAKASTVNPDGGTSTGLAMEKARQMFAASSLPSRPGAVLIVIFCSDGKPTDGTAAYVEAAKLKSMGVQVLGLGFGQLDADSLDRLSSFDRTFAVSDIDQLVSLVEASIGHTTANHNPSRLASVSVEVDITNKPVTWSQVMDLDVDIVNTGNVALPVGTVLTIDHVHGEAKDHFLPTTVELQATLLPHETAVVRRVQLRQRAGAGVDTLPAELEITVRMPQELGLKDPVGAAASKTCVGWRQTAGCNPSGARESDLDRDCDTSIHSHWSGYCQCVNGIKRHGVWCNHEPFRCKDVCDNSQQQAADAQAKYIAVPVKVDKPRMRLRTEMFAGNVLVHPCASHWPLNVMFNGRVGAGKSALASAINTCVSVDVRNVHVHGTAGRSSFTDHLTQRMVEHFPVRLHDTEGFQTTNYDQGVLRYFYRGRLGHGFRGTTMAQVREELARRWIVLEWLHDLEVFLGLRQDPHVDVAVFVVAKGITTDDPRAQAMLRENIRVAQLEGLPVLVAVSFIDDEPLDQLEARIKEISSILGVNPTQIYAVSAYHSTNEKTFDIDRKSMRLLEAILHAGEIYRNNRSQNKRAELWKMAEAGLLAAIGLVSVAFLCRGVGNCCSRLSLCRRTGRRGGAARRPAPVAAPAPTIAAVPLPAAPVVPTAASAPVVEEAPGPSAAAGARDSVGSAPPEASPVSANENVQQCCEDPEHHCCEDEECYHADPHKLLT